MTYTVLVETLNGAQSINPGVALPVQLSPGLVEITMYLAV